METLVSQSKKLESLFWIINSPLSDAEIRNYFVGEVSTFKIQILYPWMESVGIYLMRFGRQHWEESERNKKGFLIFVFAVKVIWNLYCVTGCAGLRIIPLQGICPCLDALWGIHLKSEAGCPPPFRVCSEALHSFGRTWWSSWGCSQQEAGTHSPWTDPRSEKLR